MPEEESDKSHQNATGAGTTSETPRAMAASTPAAGKRANPRKRIFSVRLEVLSKNTIFTNLLSGIVGGLISSTAAGNIIYHLQGKAAESDESHYATKVKVAVADGSKKSKAGFAYMATNTGGALAMNSYLLPHFPENLLEEVNHNTKSYLIYDSG